MGAMGVELGVHAIVKVLARLGGRAMMELIYHGVGGMSSGAVEDCRVDEGIAPHLERLARDGEPIPAPASTAIYLDVPAPDHAN